MPRKITFFCATLVTLATLGSSLAQTPEKPGQAAVPSVVVGDGQNSGTKLNVSRPVEIRPNDTGPSQAMPTSIIACAEVSVDVAAASLDEQRLVCSAASEALQLLGRCEVSLQRPLHIEMSKLVRNPFGGAIFGRFDIKQEVVFVTQYANIPSLAEGTPYSDFPPADFYRSLIVHEVIHGAMHQNYKRQPTSRAAHEYPAYALQFASLPSNMRDKFLRTINDKSGKSEFLFNDMILAVDPFFFAARAYEHFTASPSGCSKLLALLEGEVDFVITLP